VSIHKHLPYENQNRPIPVFQSRSRRKPMWTWRLDSKNIQQYLGFNSCNSWKGGYVKCICHLFMFSSWTDWRSVMIHWLFSHSIYWLKIERKQDVILQEEIFFLHSLVCLIYFSKCESVSDKLHPALYNITLTCSSHVKLISGFILYTLFSSDHCEFLKS